MDPEQAKKLVFEWTSTQLSYTFQQQLDSLTNERIEAQKKVSDSTKLLKEALNQEDPFHVHFSKLFLSGDLDSLKSSVKRELEFFPRIWCKTG